MWVRKIYLQQSEEPHPWSGIRSSSISKLLYLMFFILRKNAYIYLGRGVPFPRK